MGLRLKEDVRKVPRQLLELPRKREEVWGPISPISQKRTGESHTGTVRFQKNSLPHRLPRSATPEKRQNRK